MIQDHPNDPQWTELKEKSIDLLRNNRSFGPATYVLILILFSFSFMNIKCTNGQKVASMSGFGLVLGSEPQFKLNDAMGGFGEFTDSPNMQDDYERYPNIWAIMAFLGALLGALTFFYRGREELFHAFGLTAALMGLTGLNILRWTMRWAIRAEQGEFGAMLKVNFTNAYWLAVWLFFLVGCVSLYRLIDPQQKELAGHIP